MDDSPPVVPIILGNPGNFNLFGWKATWIPGVSRIITPWKIHMEPENHLFEKESQLNQTMIFRLDYVNVRWFTASQPTGSYAFRSFFFKPWSQNLNYG